VSRITERAGKVTVTTSIFPTSPPFSVFTKGQRGKELTCLGIHMAWSTASAPCQAISCFSFRSQESASIAVSNGTWHMEVMLKLWSEVMERRAEIRRDKGCARRLHPIHSHNSGTARGHHRHSRHPGPADSCCPRSTSGWCPVGSSTRQWDRVVALLVGMEHL